MRDGRNFYQDSYESDISPFSAITKSDTPLLAIMKNEVSPLSAIIKNVSGAFVWQKYSWMSCFCSIWESCHCGTSLHLNYKQGKLWTFDFQMLVSITGSVLLIFELLVSFNIIKNDIPLFGHEKWHIPLLSIIKSEVSPFSHYEKKVTLPFQPLSKVRTFPHPPQNIDWCIC